MNAVIEPVKKPAEKITAAAEPAAVADRSAELAAFVADYPSASIPAELLTKVEEYVLDLLGHGAYSANNADSTPAFVAGVRSLDPQGSGYTVVGRSDTWSQAQAVLLNGAFAHSMDFDDTFVRGMLHPGAPVIPSVLAMAEGGHASGRSMLDATAIGYEVACRIGAAMHPENAYDRGFHTTSVAGLFGAVAAAARLLRLKRGEVANAFGIAGSLAAGSMQYLSNGSWNKRLHPGFAGQSAFTAIALARAGVIGAQDPIAGRYGVLTGYTDDPYPDLLTADLGSEWFAAETAIKPYPSCRMAHGAIDACIALREQVAAGARPQARIRIEISPKAFDLVGEAVPNKVKARNIVDAQFSVYFQAACAWLHGSANWKSYERIGDAQLEDMASRIEVAIDPAMTHGGARVTVSGPAWLSMEVRIPSGEPAAPLSRQQILDKFLSLASSVYGDARAQQIAATVFDLRNQASGKAFVASLRSAA